MNKPVIYQLLVRLFGNSVSNNVINGTLEQNGCGKFNHITTKALNELKSLGVTHVWFTGIIEHATTTNYEKNGIAPYPNYLVKGNAGSPYAIVDYYDVAPDLAEDVNHRMDEFDALLKRCKACGLKVIIDYIPNHLARVYSSDVKPKGIIDFGLNDDTSQPFSTNNNFYYLPNETLNAPVKPKLDDKEYVENPAKITGNDCVTSSPSINDWYETVKLNYGVDLFHGRSAHFDPIPDTWHKMVDVLLYWASKGIDGFRVDMAEMVPVSYWHYAIEQAKAKYPNLLFIGEVYNPSQYVEFINHGGFDWLYDKVGMYDTLREVVQGYRPASDISHAREAFSSYLNNMLYFVENHDEQRVASSFFAGSAQKAWPAFFVSATLAKNPIMIYFGQEVGVEGMDNEGFSGLDGRTTIFDYWGVKQFQNWTNDGAFDGAKLLPDQQKIRNDYKKLLTNILSKSPFVKGEFYDLTYANGYDNTYPTNSIYAYLRYDEASVFLLVVNFSDSTHNIRVIVPEHALKLSNIIATSSFKSDDLMGYSRGIECPVQVAITNGIGITIEAFQTAVFQLK